MNMIFHRDKSGTVTIGDDIAIKIPEHEVALSLIAHNTIQNGEEFRIDGWVYGPDNIKHRKWFKSLPDTQTRFWEPKIQNLSILESKRWKWHNRSCKISELGWQQINIAISNPELCRGWAKPGAEGWVVLECDDQGIYWSWLDHLDKDDPRRQAPIKQDIVDLWFEWEQKRRTAWNRSSLFNAALMYAIKSRYQKQIEPTCSLLHIIINKRHYWFQHSRYSGLERLAFPEDTSVMTINSSD